MRNSITVIFDILMNPTTHNQYNKFEYNTLLLVSGLLNMLHKIVCITVQHYNKIKLLIRLSPKYLIIVHLSWMTSSTNSKTIDGHWTAIEWPVQIISEPMSYRYIPIAIATHKMWIIECLVSFPHSLMSFLYTLNTKPPSKDLGIFRSL